MESISEVICRDAPWMKINPNMAGWGRVLFFGSGADYLWPSAFFPKEERTSRFIARQRPSNPFQQKIVLELFPERRALFLRWNGGSPLH